MKIYFYSIKISEQTLKLGDIVAIKKEFHASKQVIALNLVDINKKVISVKFKHRDKGFKCFIGYKDDNIVRPLCIILPQMSGYIKYFESGGKNISFMIGDNSVLVKYNEIWNNVKKILNIKFNCMSVYDEKYIKAKLREFEGVVNTNFCGDETPRESVHHTCRAYININSVLKIEKKNYPQVYLEECKYKIKKKKMPKFIDLELESDSSSDFE